MRSDLGSRVRRLRFSALPIVIALAIGIVPLSATPAFASARFHIECDFHHLRRDDPIVYPHEPGMSHLHEFFGNTSTDADSTWLSLRRAGTTCNNRGDKAAYWVPAVLKNGSVVRAIAGHFYYRGIHHTLSAIRAFPPGLKIIAGDAHAMQLQSTRVVAWSCQGSSGTGRARIRDCGPGGHVKALIHFPSCWDGSHKDSLNHKSHMAYATRLGGGRRGCPRAHPVPVPELTMAIVFPIRSGVGVRLASGPTYTLHADFFNAWNQTVLKNLIQNCIRANREC
jgi:uncharacterized protein DUF1996